ncbi:pyridoxal-phosphate dependent enzyme [Klebsiella variicola subsp. variicola]|nr:pyridoxal-phosphate dependent enzyme [Klebsiella variicola subsp. variicola]
MAAYLEVQAQVAAHPERYFYPDQYNNPVNPQTHFATTGKEIWEQSGKQVTHFVAGMGTSGSFVGTARRLKFEDPRVKTLAVQPASPFHGIEGLSIWAAVLNPAFSTKPCLMM